MIPIQILVFLTYSFVSINADPVICVDFVFWTKLWKRFTYSLLSNLFFQGLDFHPIFCFSSLGDFPSTDYQTFM